MTKELFAAVTKFLAHHATHKADGLRLGQRFCNTYIKESWPELYYEADNERCCQLIAEWLERHQYVDCLPQPIERIALPH